MDDNFELSNLFRLKYIFLTGTITLIVAFLAVGPGLTNLKALAKAA
jgi:hypothetical protein